MGQDLNFDLLLEKMDIVAAGGTDPDQVCSKIVVS